MSLSQIRFSVLKNTRSPKVGLELVMNLKCWELAKQDSSFKDWSCGHISSANMEKREIQLL